MKLFNCEVSCETCSAIGQFTIVWSRFELELFENSYSINKYRGILVKRIGYDIIEKVNSLKMALIDFAQNCYQNDFDWTKKLCIRDKEYYEKEQIKKFFCNEILVHEEYIKIGIFICGRIRNNLLHGLKDVYYLDKQLKIFVAAKNFIETIVNESIIEVKNTN